MAAKSIFETKQVRYLLGLSFPAERNRIESEFFDNEAAFQEMLAAEDDLIDAYARGELVGEERLRFEKIFVASFHGRERVQFARAFASAISTTRPVESKLPRKLLDIFKTFSSSDLLRTARIATVIVFVSVLAWLVFNWWRMSNELRELHAASEEIHQRQETFERSTEIERIRTAEIAQLAVLGLQPDKPKHRKRKKVSIQLARYMAEAKNDREKFVMIEARPSEILDGVDVDPLNYSRTLQNISTSGGITLRGNAKDPQGNVVSGATVTLTDSARNFIRTQSTNEKGAYVFEAIPQGTYSIEVTAPGFRTSSVSGLAILVDTPTVREVQLEIGDVSETVNVSSASESTINVSDASLGNSFERQRITQLPLDARKALTLQTLQPSSVNGNPADESIFTLNGEYATIRIQSSLSWIRFQLLLKTTVIHEDYRVTIMTADGRTVTSLDWSEPLTPNQTIIDTPVFLTGDLVSGDYVLVLMGKEPDGSFAKAAEYSFKVFKN